MAESCVGLPCAASQLCYTKLFVVCTLQVIAVQLCTLCTSCLLIAFPIIHWSNKRNCLCCSALYSNGSTKSDGCLFMNHNRPFLENKPTPIKLLQRYFAFESTPIYAVLPVVMSNCQVLWRVVLTSEGRYQSEPKYVTALENCHHTIVTLLSLDSTSYHCPLD